MKKLGDARLRRPVMQSRTGEFPRKPASCLSPRSAGALSPRKITDMDARLWRVSFCHACPGDLSRYPPLVSRPGYTRPSENHLQRGKSPVFCCSPPRIAPIRAPHPATTGISPINACSRPFFDVVKAGLHALAAQLIVGTGDFPMVWHVRPVIFPRDSRKNR